MPKHSRAHLVPAATASGLYVDRVSRYLTCREDDDLDEGADHPPC